MKSKFYLLAFFLLLFDYSNHKKAFAQDGVWTQTPTQSLYLTSVETTPWGVATGEKDTRTWLNPFNGIYITKDLGNTWSKLGLDSTGVTDITYGNQTIYVATYYFKQGNVGVYISKDGGVNWTHSGNNFSGSSISVDQNTIIFGTYSHGLWVSLDNGSTWQQKVGDGFYGPNILTVKATSTTSLATTSTKTYISSDGASTWAEIAFLNGKRIEHVEIYKNILLAGASDGLYKSTDFGSTWSKVQAWGNFAVGGISTYKGVFFAGKQTLSSTTFGVFRSDDFGSTWADTGLSIVNPDGNIQDITWLFSKPPYLFAQIPGKGIYKYDIPPKQSDSLSFLEIPWKVKNNNEYIDKITTFFDHEYPLLGYIYYSEPQQSASTTLNYLGIREKEPYMYYSSHNGIDYALLYGTPILAAASGYASYYYCTDCGNTIKINHLNGYESIYMHLQSEGLITKDAPVWVNAGDQIGLVGMTGRTTGPHLHFEIEKDKNNDGFNNDFPDGLVDPFSWQNDNFIDPWELYSWTDILGRHSGGKSYYLWKNQYPESTAYIKTNTQIAQDNKKVSFDQDTSVFGLTVFLKPYFEPILSDVQDVLKYISNTSFLLDAYTNVAEQVKGFDKPVNIDIDISKEDVSDIVMESLKIYYWDETSLIWTPLQTTVDLISKKLLAQTTHFSHFAVFGEKIDNVKPTTEITLSGKNESNWYLEYPTVTLTSADNLNDNIDKIFYSLDDGINWYEYKQPFVIQKEGVSVISYKAMDKYQNIEDAKDFLVRIDTLGKWKKTLYLKQATFTTL